ncbi:class I SAM-dependent methyltransferase [Inediibacterium massiliense]|uniref:class I SAM-dependent methyltransferase n=1 Tax=Inediibacterium massiliense TaxID=1658111 RepID=UPI0006B59E00|nr:methyltransferase domain-containing protein [Inediibacterium massiliense]
MKLTDIWGFMLNKRAKSGSQRVLESLQIKDGDMIADIGSGGGYFTFEFAKMVGKNGKVFAVDTNTALLRYINNKLKIQKIQNVVTIIAKETGFVLPDGTCNLIFVRNVFHHINNAEVYFRNIQKNLNPNGKIAIIEWLPNTKRGYPIRTDHSTSEIEIRKVMKVAGFQQIRSFDFLDNQSFNIFKLNSTSSNSF